MSTISFDRHDAIELRKAQQFYTYLFKIGRRYMWDSIEEGLDLKQLILNEKKNQEAILRPWALHKLFMALLFMKIQSDDFYKIDELKRRIIVNMHKAIENADEMGKYSTMGSVAPMEITLDNKGVSVDELNEMNKEENMVAMHEGENGVFLNVCDFMKRENELLQQIFKDYPRLKIIKDFAVAVGITKNTDLEDQITKIADGHPYKNYIQFLKKTKKKKRKKTKRNRKKNKKN